MRRFQNLLAMILFFALAIGWGQAVQAEPLTQSVLATAIEENLHARSAVLMDAGTRKILVAKNPDQQVPIASVTKLMTMLLTLEAIEDGRVSCDDEITASPHACSYGGAQIYLEPGERFSVREMMMAVTIKSANDAAIALAEHVSGSESAFVAAMNQRAQELGMQNTHFINACGLDDISVTGNPQDKGYSSAHDVALMSVALLQHHEHLQEWLTTRITYLQRPKGPIELFNTNHRFIRGYLGADGLKTGLTDDARYCLSATAERNGFRLIAVALGVESDEKRFQDVSTLLNYGFANFIGKTLIAQQEIVASLPVNRGRERQVALVAADNLAVLLKKGQSMDDLEKEIVLSAAPFAPIARGDKLGVLKLRKGNDVIGQVDLVAAADVPKIGFYANLLRLIHHWLGL